MKVLVTGAGGYIGCNVVSALLDLNCEVIAVDLKLDRVDDRAEKVETTIFSGNSDIYKDLGAPDVCIHLAWRDGFKHNSDAHMTDLSKHYEFLTNMIKGGLKRLSVMGTMHEVGYWEGVIDENTPCNPLSQYGIAKNALRQSIMLFAKENDCAITWLRAYYITGDDLRNNSIFAKISQAVIDGKKEFPFTTGKNKYDFIDIKDLSNMIGKASIQNKILGIVNVCSGKPMALSERVERFIREHDFNIKLRYGAYPDRPYDSPGVWGDSSKINEIINNFTEN